MRKLLLTTTFAAGLAAGLAPAAHAAAEHFEGKMSTAAEVPPHDTKGGGTVDVVLDTATHKATYTIVYEGLPGPATAAHFHGPAAAGANAGVLVPIAGDLASPIKGTVTLTPEQEKDFESGQVYANIHTEANKGGEIRGQLAKAAY